jgi:hypothetical protein
MKRILPGLLIVFSICNSCNDPESAPVQHMSFEIAPDFESPDEERWIFISDKEGNFIDLAEVQNGVTLVLDVPMEVVDSVSISFFTVKKSSGVVVRDIESFMVSHGPGEEYNISPGPPPTGRIAKVTVEFENLPANHELKLSGATDVTRLDNTLTGFARLQSDGTAMVFACVLDKDNNDFRIGEFRFLGTTAPPKTFDYTTADPLITVDLEVPEGKVSIEQSFFVFDKEFPLQKITNTHVTPAGPIQLFKGSDHVNIRVIQDFAIHTMDWREEKLPTEFIMLDATAQLEKDDAEGFTISVMTDEDIEMLQTGYTNEETIGGVTFLDSRTLYYGFQYNTEHIIKSKHPKIPDELLKRYFPHGEKRYPLDGVKLTHLRLDYLSYLSHRLFLGNFFSSLPYTSTSKSIAF